MISGNAEYGVAIDGPGTADNRVRGNYLGTDVSGTLDLGNTFAGILITGAARHNVVGGPVGGARNVISGNDDNGVRIQGAGTTGNGFWGTSSEPTRAAPSRFRIRLPACTSRRMPTGT